MDEKKNSMDIEADIHRLRIANHTLGKRNEELVALLRTSRDKLAVLHDQMAALAQPPSTYGILLESVIQEDNNRIHTAEVFTSQRRMRLLVAPNVDFSQMLPGALVRLGEGQHVVEVCDPVDTGSVVTVVEVVDSRIIASNTAGEEFLLHASPAVQEKISDIDPGDSLLAHIPSGWAFEKIEREDHSSLILEDIPDVSYEDIGGLSSQIEEIRDAVELPFIHHQKFLDYGLQPPKGVLLYGPPGCGKTLIAKAVASSLSRSMSQGSSYFLNVKGPELLNKFVGETERQIRSIFSQARKVASSGTPVIIFFDEMESIFRTRGTGISSDMEATVVPQLLAELDGVEKLENVIVIGASNREELIDPAILRPGRLDVKIKINRPDEDAARDILSKYLHNSLPIAPSLREKYEDPASALRERVVERIYGMEQPYLTLSFADGTSHELFYKDFISGATLANIVDRAKVLAIKESLKENSEEGIGYSHIDEAVRAELAHSEDMPDTTNPAEWARISGLGHKMVVDIVVHEIGHH